MFAGSFPLWLWHPDKGDLHVGMKGVCWTYVAMCSSGSWALCPTCVISVCIIDKPLPLWGRGIMGRSISGQVWGTLKEEGCVGEVAECQTAPGLAMASAFSSLIFMNTLFIHKFLKGQESLFNELLWRKPSKRKQLWAPYSLDLWPA